MTSRFLLVLLQISALSLQRSAFSVQPSAFSLQRFLCVYWAQGIDTKAALDAAGIKHVCVPPEQLDAWRAAGVDAVVIGASDLTSRDALPTPGIAARAGVASPTRAPWIDANGWRVTRNPTRKYVYDLPAGKAPLAAAEAFAYGANAILKIDPADVQSLGAMMVFLEKLPASDLPDVADVAVVDDGSPVTGEVMNLLARRNLLFESVKTPSSRFVINIVVGSPEFPAAEAADPSAFALKVRHRLTDERRSLRVFGSEVVICRLTGDADRIRLHLINYGGRDIEGLRIRLRGTWGNGEALVAGAGPLPLGDYLVADGATEFSIPRLATYAVVDLKASR
jgi:hypothetical protein